MLILLPPLLCMAWPAPPAPPETPRQPTSTTYHGVAVNDDYQWLEAPDAATKTAAKAWSDAQNAYARGALDALPQMGPLRERLRQLQASDSVRYGAFVARGDTLFALKRQPPKQQAFLVAMPRSVLDVRDAMDGALPERVIVDPETLSADKTTRIDFFVPSRDGRLVAVCLSDRGTESGDVHVYDVATGKPLADVIPRVNGGTAGGSVAWNADGTGFFYTRYPRAGERPEDDLGFFQQVWFHALGTPTEQDRYEIGKEFPRIAEVELFPSPDGSFLVARVANGDGGEFEVHLRRADGRWERVSAFADEVIDAGFSPDNMLYLLSRKGAPRGRLLRVSAADPQPGTPVEVVPQSDGVIESFLVTPTRIFVSELVGGPSRVRVFERAATGPASPAVTAPIEVALPAAVAAGSFVRLEGGAPDDALMHVASFVQPARWLRVHRDGTTTATPFVERTPADFSAVEVVRDFATAADGTKLPITILQKRGTPRDGNNPTVIYGYGGYGVSLTPELDPSILPWLERGGVYAIANVRGGGEFGEQWHRAGSLLHKQTVFDDFAACAKHLVDTKVTGPGRLGAMGGSNGGLLMGAMIVQHPELFRAIVSFVGIYDMLRVERGANGQFNITEFGTVADPAQFEALLAYSPLHNVKDGTAYPAVLMLTGDNDPRVEPWHSRKMVARLQAASTSGRPILLRTSGSSGHGASNLDERIAQDADAWAFLAQELGMTRVPVDPRSPPNPTPP
ncbi:MAG: prolyl oligopeptidase family serine peptidase [Phycisphaerales bacterium]